MRKLFVFTLLLGVALISVGCGPTYRTQQGAVIGATLGALAGHDIGEDTESTLIGAAVGGVAGAVIGDAYEKYESQNGEYPYNYPPAGRYQNSNQAPSRR